MTVDKFGRHKKDDNPIKVKNEIKLSYLNNNFIRQEEQINMHGHRISNLGSAVSPKDAISKDYCDRFIREGDSFSMRDNRITALGAPTELSDATNKEYVDNKFQGDFNMHDNRIINVANPTEPTDAANLASIRPEHYFFNGTITSQTQIITIYIRNTPRPATYKASEYVITATVENEPVRLIIDYNDNQINIVKTINSLLTRQLIIRHSRHINIMTIHAMKPQPTGTDPELTVNVFVRSYTY